MMDPYVELVNKATKVMWDRQPKLYQSSIASHLLKMIGHIATPETILTILPTGSGKSAIPQTVSFITGGITIIIESTLALGSDQTQKIRDIETEPHSNKHIKAYQLDSFKTRQQKDSLSDAILKHCSSNSYTSIILFTSPECLLDKIWKQFFKDAVVKGFLKLFCIDEIHLFVEFGFTFRKRFISLKDYIFSHQKYVSILRGFFNPLRIFPIGKKSLEG